MDLEQFGSVPVDYTVLAAYYRHLRSPKDKISSLVRKGELLPLKKGKYIVSAAIKEHPVSRELVANHLYGPSYVSFETALSYHGWIPERSFMVKSAITKRRKSFSNSLGTFEYVTVPEEYFPIGIQQVTARQNITFLIASPEKALCDLIMTSKGLRIQSLRALRAYIEEDMRIDAGLSKNIDLSVFSEAAAYGYKKKAITLLHDYFAG